MASSELSTSFRQSQSRLSGAAGSRPTSPALPVAVDVVEDKIDSRGRLPSRSAASPRPDPSRALTSPILPSTKELSRVSMGTSEESASTGGQTPKRGRTRTVAPVIGRAWQTQDSVPPQAASRDDSLSFQTDALNLAVLEAEDLGVGVGGHKLGVRQPERQVLTPCASPPKRSIHAMVLPISISTGEPVSHGEEALTRRSASPRDSPVRGSVETTGSVLSLEAVEDVFQSKPVAASSGENDPPDDHDNNHNQDVESIEAALTDAMETSLELPSIDDEAELDAGRYDTIRSTGKRKNQEEPAVYPEKKGKVAGIVARFEQSGTVKSRPSIFDRSKTDGERYRRPMSMIIQDSASPIAISANVQASAEMVTCRPSKDWSRAQTVRGEVSLQKRPSIDNLIKDLEPIGDATASMPNTWKSRGRLPRRGTTPSMIRALEQKDPADQKARPSLVKQVTEVILSPRKNTLSSRDGDEPGAQSARLTETEALRTASISLKRIQDDDLERVMHAYQTRSRSHSPASQLEAAYRANEASGTTASNGMSWDTLHRQNVMERARNAGSEWLRGRGRAGTLNSVWPNALKASQPPVTPVSGRPASLNRSVSYTGNTPQHSRRLGPYTADDRRQSAGEATLMHTRWDGTRTPITERDHPTHYAALQEHRLVRQKSKSSLSAVNRSPTPDLRAPGKDYEAEHTTTAPVAPPVSIERWRQQLHQAGGRNLPQVKSTSQYSPSEGSRPAYRHSRTLPLPLDTAILSRSPTLSRSNHSQDSHLPLSACSGTSFDVKTAYDIVKAERGLVSFDQIPGLNDGE